MKTRQSYRIKTQSYRIETQKLCYGRHRSRILWKLWFAHGKKRLITLLT